MSSGRWRHGCSQDGLPACIEATAGYFWPDRAGAGGGTDWRSVARHCGATRLACRVIIAGAARGGAADRRLVWIEGRRPSPHNAAERLLRTARKSAPQRRVPQENIGLLGGTPEKCR